MRRRMLCKFGPLSNVDADFIIFPFQDEHTVMMVILPEEQSGVDHVLRNLHNVKVKNIMRDTEKTNLDVSIPKFKIETETNLIEPMKKLGMTDMFLDSANFSRISNDRLAVDKIIQKVNIEVNELGSSATGATALSLESRSMAEEYQINRPFLFLIVTKGLVIFSGVITDPSHI
ncbi:antichymotrypsin-2-like [Aphidius gifuensis]|uniref:antichymotrypsin-2-like n=1 Tax=Aphidius gifuensis TaxID=684658 RepID=UPI001CDCBCA8|nr:antichymotrypsin-2-like [Aphidius gifuensis]